MGTVGDIIVFKVMRVRLYPVLISWERVFFKSNSCLTLLFCYLCLLFQGRIKHIHENMPKNAIEPSPKFDCHLSRSANRVTSLLSYRAFELTQVNTCSFILSFLHTFCYQIIVMFPFLERICKFQHVTFLLSLSNISSSLHLKRSKHDLGTSAPTLWFLFSTKAKKQQQQLLWLHIGTFIPAGNVESHFVFSDGLMLKSWECSSFLYTILILSLTGLTQFPLKEVEVKDFFSSYVLEKYVYTPFTLCHSVITLSNCFIILTAYSVQISCMHLVICMAKIIKWNEQIFCSI